MTEPRQENESVRASKHPLLVLLLVVFSTLALIYSIATPIFEGPDEDDHFRYAKYLADRRALPVQLFQPGGGEAGHQGWQPPLYYALIAIAIGPIDTSDFPQHLWRNPAASFQGDRTCCGRNLYFHTVAEDLPYTRTTLAVHLGRVVSIAFGVITVACIYFLAITILPGQSWAALAAATVAGLNPTFLFASSIISNDIPLAALCSLALLVCAKILLGQLQTNLKSFALLGVTIGLGLLIKTTALGLLPIAFGVASWRAITAGGEGKSVRTISNAGIGILGPIVILSGWWFVRNQVLYGDALAFRLINASAIFPRDLPLTWPELLGINLPWLWRTFWGGPTPGDFAGSLLILLAVLTALAGVGIVILFWRRNGVPARAGILLLTAWLVFILVAQLQFIRTSGGTDQGRYLFPAIASFAALFILGLAEIGKIAWRTAGADHPESQKESARLLYAGLALGAFALALYSLFANTMPAYARPPQEDSSLVAHAEKRIDANFSNQLALEGYSLSTRALRPRETLDITLYWQSLTQMKDSYRVFVHLVNSEGRVAAGKDVIPYGGAYSTVLWKPGEWLADHVTLQIEPEAIASAYQLEVGVYPFGEPENRLNLAGSEQDHVLVDAIVIQH